MYNSLSTQLILGAGAIHFGKMKTIAAKNLAISALCLRFFLKVFDTLQSKFTSLIQ
jgi:Vps54-like protein